MTSDLDISNRQETHEETIHDQVLGIAAQLIADDRKSGNVSRDSAIATAFNMIRDASEADSDITGVAETMLEPIPAINETPQTRKIKKALQEAYPDYEDCEALANRYL